MPEVTLDSGRTVDNTCPFSSDCFAQGYCNDGCPPTPYTILKDIARLEHELGMLPHDDPDVVSVCPCHSINDVSVGIAVVNEIRHRKEVTDG